MKTLFIDAKSDAGLSLDKKQVESLSKRGVIGIVTTVQHLDKIKDVQKQIKHSVVAGQVLGCNVKSAERVLDKVDAFLYVGTGKFHPIAAAMLGKPVFVFNPVSRKLSKIHDMDVAVYEKRKKSAFLKFLSSDNIGVIVSTKRGQDRVDEAWELEKKYKDKNFYMFVADNIDISQVENFPFVDCWINTACPRIVEDFWEIGKAVVNIDELK